MLFLSFLEFLRIIHFYFINFSSLIKTFVIITNRISGFFSKKWKKLSSLVEKTFITKNNQKIFFLIRVKALFYQIKCWTAELLSWKEHLPLSIFETISIDRLRTWEFRIVIKIKKNHQHFSQQNQNPWFFYWWTKEIVKSFSRF